MLRRAIRGGSLPAVDIALVDVEHVDLEDALEILVLMAAAHDPRFNPWARRWLERVAHEERQQLERQLMALPGDPRALEALRERGRWLRQAHPVVRVHALDGRGRNAPEGAPS